MIVTYRRAVPGDAARLAAFATQTFVRTYAAHNTPEDMQQYLSASYGVDHQARELSDPGMITVIAESDGALVGYGQVRRKGAPECVTPEARAEIYRLYVDATAHGKGVAQRIMDECLIAARDLGATHVWLGVWEKNPRAIAFYEKSGFREVGTQVFQLGADRQRDLVFMRPVARCHECGAPLEDGRSCRDYFNDLLAREWEVPGGPGQRAHFLAVASYNLQHPSQFSGAVLVGLRRTLSDVLGGRATIADALSRARAADGPTRVQRRAGDPAQPDDWPARWPMSVRDVCDVPASRYLEQVQAWATSVDTTLSASSRRRQ